MLQPAWQTGRLLLTGEMRHEGSWQNMMSAQTLLEARDAKPDACTDTFTMIHSVLDEVVMREQAGMRSLLSKLLAVVMWVMLLVCVVCRILSRRYGCRMIYPLGEYLLYTSDRWKERRLPSELLTYIEKRNDRRQFQ